MAMLNNQMVIIMPNLSLGYLRLALIQKTHLSTKQNTFFFQPRSVGVLPGRRVAILITKRKQHEYFDMNNTD